MTSRRTARQQRRQQGVALLIAIFVLLLVSVVAIALLVSSGTETALGANYRSSSTVYYAALAGLEEARGRLLPKNANYFGSLAIPTPFPLGQPLYVINALPSETVAPWDPSNQYYDKEYANEFTVQASAASFQSAYSVWNNNAQGIPGPVYKWVRITAATELSLNLDVDSNGTLDHTTLVYYCPSLVNSQGNPAPSLIVPTSTTCPSTAVQALQITALAYLPNGSQKYLQYVVAPAGPQGLAFPAALTMDGPNVGINSSYLTFPWGAGFIVDGRDLMTYAGTPCASGSNPQSPVRGIGYLDQDQSYNNIISAIQQYSGGSDTSNDGDFRGLGGTILNVFNVGPSPPNGPPSLASNMQTLSGLNSLVASISQGADVTLSGPVTQSNSNNLMPTAMSATNPMTVVVNGNFTEAGWSGTGYGVLLVTGVLTYDPNSSWDGIVLVIGQGVMTSSGGGTGSINGAVLIATTLDSAGNPLSSLGSPEFYSPNQSGNQGNNGIYYSSCWVQAAQTPGKYQVLSFKEIPVP
jgi:hypothetical protein